MLRCTATFSRWSSSRTRQQTTTMTSADDPPRARRRARPRPCSRLRRRELLLEEGPRPRLRERALLDREDGVEVGALHRPERDLRLPRRRSRSRARSARARHQRISADAQVKPAPNAARQTSEPSRTRPAAPRLVERERDRGGRRVPVPLDVVEHLLGRQLEPHRDQLRDAQVRLVRDEEVDVGDRVARSPPAPR